MKAAIKTSPDYSIIAHYAEEKQYACTLRALETVTDIMTLQVSELNSRSGTQSTHTAYLRHALSVCRMLIELHIPFSGEEEDILLAASLCHILPETIRFDNLEKLLTIDHKLHPDVYRTVSSLFREDSQTAAEQRRFFSTIQDNKLALMIKLADRGNLTEQLYSISGWEARKYIQETKAEFFPMCIYAKEHYPDLLAPVSVLMEKIRCLTDVAEILLSRYEERVSDLSNQILALQEENAAIRRIIHALQANP